MQARSGVWPLLHVAQLVGHAQGVLPRRVHAVDGRIGVEAGLTQQAGGGHAGPVENGLVVDAGKYCPTRVDIGFIFLTLFNRAFSFVKIRSSREALNALLGGEREPP